MHGLQKSIHHKTITRVIATTKYHNFPYTYLFKNAKYGFNN